MRVTCCSFVSAANVNAYQQTGMHTNVVKCVKCCSIVGVRFLPHMGIHTRLGSSVHKNRVSKKVLDSWMQYTIYYQFLSKYLVGGLEPLDHVHMCK